MPLGGRVVAACSGSACMPAMEAALLLGRMRLHAMRSSLELSMIVKNGGASLRRCLDSVAGIVDRVSIGDTGSTDSTVEVAQQCGALVTPLRWNDDFAEARNEMLARARCDWILVLDADEMLNVEELGSIPALLQQAEVWGYDVIRWNYVDDIGFRSGSEQARSNPGVLKEALQYRAYFTTEHTRLFRRDARIRFEHCVHESVVHSMDAARLSRRQADFTIHHFGYVESTKSATKEKDEIYHQLSLVKVSKARSSYEANIEAGLAELDHAKRFHAALEYFTTAISINPAHHAAWLVRGICLTRLKRYPEALEDLMKALSLHNQTALLYSAIGDVHFQCGSYGTAGQAYRTAQVLGDASPLTCAKLGASEVQSGARADGVARVQDAVNSSPESAELLDILATAALAAGLMEVACKASRRRLALGDVSSHHYAVAVTSLALSGEPLAATEILRQGQLLFPVDRELKDMAATLKIDV